MDGQAVAIPFGHDRARLHGVHDQSLMGDVDRDDMGCRLESGVGFGGIAEAVEADPVAGRALPDLGRIGLQRVLDLAHRRQGIVLDLDQLGRILRLAAALGDHRHDRLADVSHDLMRQRTTRVMSGLLPSALGNIAGKAK